MTGQTQKHMQVGMGVWEFSEHARTSQSHRQEKEEAQVMLSHDTYGIPTFMVF